MRIKTSFFVLLICWLLGTLNVQAGQSLLLSTSYWVDSSTIATVEEAKNASYIPFSGVLNKGYTTSVVWVRAHINGSIDSQHVIKMGPSFLREITLFDPLAIENGKIKPAYTGRSVPLSERDRQGISPEFVIPASIEPRDVYLRIKSPTSIVFYLDIEPIKQAQHDDFIIQNILSIYLGFLLLTCLWGVINWIIQQDVIYAWFTVRQVLSCFHIIAYYGLYHYVFSDSLSVAAGDHYYNLSLISTAFVVFTFDVWLLGNFGVWNKLRQLMLYAVWIMPPLFFYLLINGQVMHTLHVNSIFISLYSILTIILAMTARTTKQLPLSHIATYVIRIGYLLKFSIVLVPVLVFQGIVVGNSLSLNMIVVHAGVSSIIVLLLLAIRNRQQLWLLQRVEIQHDIDKASLASEKKRRKEKESFLSMITHELRNPLSVININTPVDNKAMHEASSDMSRLLERVEQSEKLDEQEITITKSQFYLDQFLKDILRVIDKEERFYLKMDSQLEIYSDEELFSNIFSNLFSNAIKYSKPNTAISLTVDKKFRNNIEGLSVIVSNTIGESGAPDDTMVFDKYYRAPAARHKIGSGLGLFLVKQWLSALNADISYQTLSGSGDEKIACFTVWIPK